MSQTFTATTLIDRGAPQSLNSNLERRRSLTTTTATTATIPRSPLLYATPEATPLPDSPSSFPPSPYIINHKRRGPRLLKTVSLPVVEQPKSQEGEEKIDESGRNTEVVVDDAVHDSHEDVLVRQPGEEEDVEKVEVNNGGRVEMGVEDSIGEFSFSTPVSGFKTNGNLGTSSVDVGFGKPEKMSQSIAVKLDRDFESEDFFDPQDSMSATSNTEVEDSCGPERFLRMTSPMGEYFDAPEELSSEGGSALLRDIEGELREMRLNLLMEIERRKQAEEALNNMQTHWQQLREKLSVVGLTLPAASPAIAVEDENLNYDPAEDLHQQIYIARFVSESVGRGLAKAEMELELESNIESKNFEITRLCDRLHYYETVNHEMSQRNQEAIEVARQLRQRRKRRRKWIWGSVGAAVTLGTAVFGWSYFHTGSGGPSSAYSSDAPEIDSRPE